jgi:hypothetical protein
MAFMEFGLGAYILALVCIIVSSLIISSLYFEWPRCWLSLAYKGCTTLFSQFHINIFLTNSRNDPEKVLAKLEREDKIGWHTKLWAGLAWPRKGRKPSREMNIEDLRKEHRRRNSDHGLVEPVAAKNGTADKATGTTPKGSVGNKQGKKGKKKKRR